MSGLACGIDFGTSNTTVALADARGSWLMPVEGEEVTIPSAIFWQSDRSPPTFGRAAIADYVEGEDGRLMRALKSTLGSRLIDERTALGTGSVSFRTVLGAYFRHLRARIEAAAGPLTQVVLGRPVHFVDGDAEADARAQAILGDLAKAQGFREVAFQFEPIAAALQYESTVAAEELVLIVDIGGGTSDFSVVRVSPDRARASDRAADILGNAGIRVGGTDFDRLLSLAELMPYLGYLAPTKGGQGTVPRHYHLDLATWHRINFLYTPRTLSDLKAIWHEADRPELIERLMRVVTERSGHRLAMAVEAAKIALSGADHARLEVSHLTGSPNPLAARRRFETAISPPLERIGGTIAEVLAEAGVTPDRIGTIFLTGGSSHLPALVARVRAALPGVRIATGDMLGSVGLGLALEARRRFG